MAETILSRLTATDAKTDSNTRNIRRHVAALSASKSADGLLSPKLVLSWLVSSLGAGAFWVGALVPVRESGALLPQILLAPRIKAMARRKWAWAAGSVGQGASVAGIVLAALTLEGQAAGAVIVTLLGILALCRSICSASYKDVLGKTVEKTARGQTTGAASTVSAAVVLVFAGILMIGPDDKFALIVGALSLAALLWVLAAMLMSRMEEDPSDTGEEDSIAAPLRLLLDRSDLRRFVLARALLVGTALAPPYVVLLASDGAVLNQLGALVFASSLGALVSSYVWGWLSDRSSRMVLVWAGIAAALALGACLWIGSGSVWAMAVALFGLMIAYNGVRQGRSTYLVDMAGENDRSAYTAVSNTAIGLVLIGVGAVAAGLAAWSVPLVLWVFIVMSLAGAAVAWSLKEVETTDA